MFSAVIVLFAVLATAIAAPLDVTLTRVVGGGGTTTTTGNAISVLSSGNIVLAGTTNGNVGATVMGSNNGFVQVFTQDGTVLWTKQERTAGTGGIVQFLSSVVDSLDNIYAVGPCAGSFYGSSQFGNYDVCVIKYDSSGNVLATFEVGANSVDLPYGISIYNADGSIYIVGYTSSALWNGQTSIGTRDGFLLKMSIMGTTSTLQGVYRFGVASFDTFFQAVAVDSAGNPWVAGYTAGATYQGQTNNGNAGVNDFVIQKMSPDGTVLFARLIGGFDHDLAAAIALDTSDSAYAAGLSLSTFDGNAPLGGNDVSVVKINSIGVKQWSKLFGGTGSDRATAITYDKVNNKLLVTGNTLSATFQEVPNPITTGTGSSFLLVLNPSTGAVLDVRVYSGSSASVGNAITTNGASIYLAGATQGTFQGQSLSGTSSAFALQVLGYGGAPSASPTARPTAPTIKPTARPSAIPSALPTYKPTFVPTADPSALPTFVPTFVPTEVPSALPTFEPTFVPTEIPSVLPTYEPTFVPTKIPSPLPTFEPTFVPTDAPSTLPTYEPTFVPTEIPSALPTYEPTFVPTKIPSALPTFEPTFVPTEVPSALPTFEPTFVPTVVPSALPTYEPTFGPTETPTIKPTAAPTTIPSAVPSATPTRACVQWALGDHGESCSATCSRMSRVCKESYFAAVVTQDAFYGVVASSVHAVSGQPLGTAAAYCSAGFNAVFAGGAPAAQTLLFVDNGVSAVHTACSYPTSLPAATVLSCDADLSGVPARRFCPCVDDTCDAPSAAPLPDDTNWYLGDTGDSCAATCTAAGRDCNSTPLSTIKTNADFLAVVASSTDATGFPVQSESFCNNGINLFEFASAPASLTVVVPSGVNKTSCTYPILSEQLNGACDVSFPRARRFCSCKIFPPTAAPTAVPTVTPTVVPSAAPSAGPTVVPSAVPTFTPTEMPTASPSAVPSASPTVTPSAVPTPQPSAVPTATPTFVPTEIPSAAPTTVPTATPTATPSTNPTATPTYVPTFAPTTVAPTATPTAVPSLPPTIQPTAAPTALPYDVKSATVFGNSYTRGTGVAALATGDAVVVGAVRTNGQYEMYVHRLSAFNSSVVWSVKQFQFDDTSGNWAVLNLDPVVAVDSQDNIYVAFTCFKTKSTIPYFTAQMCLNKYTSSGTVVYTAVHTVPADQYSDYATYVYGITIDDRYQRQAVYVVGGRQVYTPTYMGLAGVLARFNTLTGEVKYATVHYDGPIYGVAVDNHIGDVWTIGNMGDDHTAQTQIVMLRINSDYGSMKSFRYIGNPSFMMGRAIVVDANNFIYCVGTTGASVDGTPHLGYADIIVNKYDIQMVKKWTRQYGSSSDDYGQGAVVDNSNGLLYLTGITRSNPFGGTGTPSGSSNAYFLAVTLSEGEQQVAHAYSDGWGYSLALTSSNIYLAGTVVTSAATFQGQPSNGNPNAFVLKLARPNPTLSGARRLTDEDEQKSDAVATLPVPSLRGAGRG